MSVHPRSNGSWTVRWRDLGRQRSRDFSSEEEARRFDDRVKEVRKARAAGMFGPDDYDGPFDPQHPQAFDHLMWHLEEVLSTQYPNHTFTFTWTGSDSGADTNGDIPLVEELPLSGSLEWEGITKAEHERNVARTQKAFERLRELRPELFTWQEPDPDDPTDKGYWSPDGGDLGEDALFAAMRESGLFDHR